MEGIFIPVSFFAMIAAIVIVPRYFKSKEREHMQATVRSAIERGQSISTETVDAIARDMKPHPSAVRDFRAAVIWFAVAAGLAIMAYMVSWEEGDAWYPMIGIASIPALVGAAYLAMGVINAATDRRRKA